MDQPPDVDLDAPMSNPEEEEDRRHHEDSEESELEGDLEDRREEEETIMERIQRRKEFEASSQHHLATMLKNESNHSHSPPEYLYPYGYLTPQHAAALAMVQGLQQQVPLPPQQPLSAASSLTGGSAGSPPNNGLDSPRGPQSEQDQSKYTYEEQFKQPMNSGTRISADDKGSFQQLYELSDDPRRKEFLDDLFSYMQKRGTPVNRIPIMAKQVLDLFELYRLVVARGGLVEVINKKIWREITKGLNLPSSITSAAFTLRTQYMKYLYPYECVKEKLSTNEELQAAIDGNKREGRRSSYGPYSDLVPAAAPRNPMGALMRPVNGHGPPAGGRASVSPLPLAYFAAAQQHNATTHLPLNLKQENGIYGNHALSSGEEDNCNSIPSTPNPMAMPQQEALNLEVSRSSSTTTTHNNNNNNNNSGEHKPLNMARKHYDDNGGPTPAKRPMTDHLNISTTNIKISNRSSDGRSQENAITVTMDVNGVLYQGMLFATNHRTRL